MLTLSPKRTDNVQRSEPNRIVRLVYFDEAGTASEAQEPILVVAAVLIDADKQWLRIEDHIAQIVQNLIPETDRESFHFHATKLFSERSKGGWTVLEAYLNIFVRYELPIAWGGVRRSLIKQQMSPTIKPAKLLELQQGVAFLMCATMVEGWFTQHACDEVGMCIGERATTGTQENLKTVFRHVRKEQLHALLPTTRFRHLIDAVSFRGRHESMGVQLADACNFFIKRHEMGKTDSEHFYKMLQPWIIPNVVFDSLPS